MAAGMTRKDDEDNGNDGLHDVEPDNIEQPPHYREGRSQVLTTDTGRQGPSGIRVLLVLVFSLGAVAIAWTLGSVFNLW